MRKYKNKGGKQVAQDQEKHDQGTGEAICAEKAVCKHANRTNHTFENRRKLSALINTQACCEGDDTKQNQVYRRIEQEQCWR